jgi:hypothetical protein
MKELPIEDVLKESLNDGNVKVTEGLIKALCLLWDLSPRLVRIIEGEIKDSLNSVYDRGYNDGHSDGCIYMASRED